MATRGDVTVRGGTSERNWYVVAGHIAAVIIGVVYFAFQARSAGSESEIMSLFVSSLITYLLFVVTGTSAMGALFKDAAYVRGRHGWNVKWWQYIGTGVGIPVLAAFVLQGFVGSGEAVVYALFIYPITTTIVGMLYLYHRHQNIGVP